MAWHGEVRKTPSASPLNPDHSPMDDPTILALLPAVDEQINSPETSFVAATLARLTGEHEIAPDEARYMIAFCLADELERLEKSETPFDLERYEMLLTLLPSMPEG